MRRRTTRCESSVMREVAAGIKRPMICWGVSAEQTRASSQKATSQFRRRGCRSARLKAHAQALPSTRQRLEYSARACSPPPSALQLCGCCQSRRVRQQQGKAIRMVDCVLIVVPLSTVALGEATVGHVTLHPMLLPRFLPLSPSASGFPPRGSG